MDDPKYKEARKRVKAKQEFYRHIGTYVVMSAFFFLLNAVTAFGHWWFFWPMLGWGMAVLFHYVDVFGIPGVEPMTAEWEERQLREEMDRLERSGKYRQSNRRETTDGMEDELDLRPLPREPRREPQRPLERRRRWDDSDLV